MTEKLYHQDPYMKSFVSRVVSCEKREGHYLVSLEATAFYPEGGGQPGDTGRLGGVEVFDTHESGGEIFHYCRAPLTPGREVCGEIDWQRRFDHMQQHSGEHIVSGLICSRFGCDNVGFHMGAERVVIDFNAEISLSELRELELEANRRIWQSIPCIITHPDEAELRRLHYRSKKELHGDVRIVEFPTADICACCGTHVETAGEIGLILLLGVSHLRDGVRIEMLAGKRAYDYAAGIIAQNRKISALLSAKPPETAAAVSRLQAELDSAKYRLVGAQNRLFAAAARENAGENGVLIFESDLEPDALRRMADAVMNLNSGFVGVFSGSDECGYKYAVGRRSADVRAFVAEMNAALSGRGGGKGSLAQGSVKALRSEIERFFSEIK